MKPSGPIIVRPHENGIFELKMNDLENGNALSEKLTSLLIEHLDELSQRSDVKVLMLTGLPTVFCSGASKELLDDLLDGHTHVKDLELPSKFLEFPLPIIVALEGHATGGGLALAMYGDITVASEKSRYGFNFMDLGFTPGMGMTTLLPQIVGHHFASEMLFTTKLYRGRELKPQNLFNHVVSHNEVQSVAFEQAQRIAEKPVHALRLLKQAMARPRLSALQIGLDQEHHMHGSCFNDPETLDIINENFASQKTVS